MTHLALNKQLAFSKEVTKRYCDHQDTISLMLCQKRAFPCGNICTCNLNESSLPYIQISDFTENTPSNDSGARLRHGSFGVSDVFPGSISCNRRNHSRKVTFDLHVHAGKTQETCTFPLFWTCAGTLGYFWYAPQSDLFLSFRRF